MTMTRREQLLFQQIHPAKLATDILMEPVSLYLLWRHQLWLGLAAHFLPPIIATIWVVRSAWRRRRLAQGPLQPRRGMKGSSIGTRRR